MTNAKVGAALVGGYLLGRTRKAKAAIGLGMFLAGRKLDLDPRQLARSLADSPALSGLGDQARRELLDATKSAATSALTERANRLADSLSERTRRLGGEDSEDSEDREDREETDELADDDREPEDAGEPEEDREREQRTRRKKPAKRPATRRRAPAAKPAAKSGPKKAAKTSRAGGKARSGGRGGDDG